MHLTRTTAVLTIVGLATYVTGLQKYVIDPVLGGFRDLDPGLQLAILAAIAVGVGLLLAVRARRRRAALDVAVERVAVFEAAGAAPVGTPPAA